MQVFQDMLSLHLHKSPLLWAQYPVVQRASVARNWLRPATLMDNLFNSDIQCLGIQACSLSNLSVREK